MPEIDGFQAKRQIRRGPGMFGSADRGLTAKAMT